jgi:hypothetical protein
VEEIRIMNEYPCKDCIVKGICSDMKNCDKTDTSLRSIIFVIENECCVDCGCTEVFETIIREPEIIICANCKNIYYKSTFGYLVKHNYKKEYMPKGLVATTFSKYLNKHEFQNGRGKLKYE